MLCGLVLPTLFLFPIAREPEQGFRGFAEAIRAPSSAFRAVWSNFRWAFLSGQHLIAPPPGFAPRGSGSGASDDAVGNGCR